MLLYLGSALIHYVNKLVSPDAGESQGIRSTKIRDGVIRSLCMHGPARGQVISWRLNSKDERGRHQLGQETIKTAKEDANDSFLRSKSQQNTDKKGPKPHDV